MANGRIQSDHADIAADCLAAVDRITQSLDGRLLTGVVKDLRRELHAVAIAAYLAGYTTGGHNARNCA